MRPLKTWECLKREEVVAVADWLEHLRADRSARPLQRRAEWWLSIGAGLRASEVAQLQMRDALLELDDPVLEIRKTASKSKHGRTVPLYWSSRQIPHLRAWRDYRIGMGAGPQDLFVCSIFPGYEGAPLSRHLVARHWKACLAPLPDHRQKQLHHHCGRHTFASHSLASGRSIAQVAEALGHQNLETTGRYLHAIDRRDLPDLYIEPGVDNEKDAA